MIINLFIVIPNSLFAPRLPCKMKLRWARIRTRRRLAGVENRWGGISNRGKGWGKWMEMMKKWWNTMEYYGFFFVAIFLGEPWNDEWRISGTLWNFWATQRVPGTLFFRQMCLESRIGGKCIYCIYTNQTGDIYRNVRDNQDNNRRGYGLLSIKQAQLASKKIKWGPVW